VTPEELKEIRSTLEFASQAGAKDEFMDTTSNLLEFIDEQAAQIEALKKEADCSDIVQALEDAGIPMGDGEQCQDIITAIEILGSRIEALKEKLVEERAIRLFKVGSNEIFAMWTLQSKEIQEEYKRDARQQLKAEMPGME